MLANVFFQPKTRLDFAPELVNVRLLMNALEKKEKQLLKSAQPKGADSVDYRKHDIVKKLVIALKKPIHEFNTKPRPKTEIQNKAEMIALVTSLYKIIQTNLDLFTNTLMAARNNNRENVNSMIDYASYVAAIASSFWLSLSTLTSLVSFFYIAPKLSKVARECLGTTSDETATMTLLKLFAKTLIDIGENLGLAKQWQLQHDPVKVNFEADITCPISFSIMKEPYLCSLDGRTYEYTAIRRWLQEHGNSPINPSAKLQNGQTPDSVLTLNYNLRNVIETYKQTHPEHFDKEVEMPRIKKPR